MNAGKETYGYDPEQKMTHCGPKREERAGQELKIKTTRQQNRLEIFHHLN